MGPAATWCAGTVDDAPPLLCIPLPHDPAFAHRYIMTQRVKYRLSAPASALRKCRSALRFGRGRPSFWRCVLYRLDDVARLVILYAHHRQRSGRPGLVSWTRVAGLSEEGASFAVEDDPELIGWDEPVALRHMECGVAPAEFVEGQRLVELPHLTDADRHGYGGAGEVLPIFTSGQT